MDQIERWTRPKEEERELIGRQIDSWDGFALIKAFEEAFQKVAPYPYVLSFSHGTAAIMAAYYAMEAASGEVITPAVGSISSYAGAMHLGSRIVFADIREKDLLIDPEEIKKKITPKTKAINVIHMNGRIVNLDEIKQFGIPILEDASHALSCPWEAQEFDGITCFSLQGVNPQGKPVGAGEGGIACTYSKTYYQRMLAYGHLHRKGILKDLAGSPFESLDDEVLGLKMRAHPLGMALGLVSLKSLEERSRKRDLFYAQVAAIVKEFEFLKLPECKVSGYFGGIKLKCVKGETLPLEYRRPLFKTTLMGSYNFSPSDYPVSESTRVLTIPSYIDPDPSYFATLRRKLHERM